MQTRSVGNSGLRVSLVGLGCNNFGRRIDAESSRAVVHAALDSGITLFDTADIYRSERGSSEEFLGKALGSRRKDVVIATKVGMAVSPGSRDHGGSRRYLISAVEESLRMLGTDWIDLYQLHKPDPATPIEETLGAFDDLIRQGKVRYVGCSNMPAWQVVDAAWKAKEAGIAHFISAQDEYSLLVRDVEREIVPMARQYGIGLLPFYPLASGLLTGKYRKDQPAPEDSRLGAHGARYGTRFLNERNLSIVENLRAFCEARGKSLLELAFSWLASQPVVSSVIAGATKPEQVKSNVAAATWALTQEELKQIDEITLRVSD